MSRAALAIGIAAAILAGGAGAAGDRAFREGRFDDAAAEYRRALERRPSPALRYNLGTTLLVLGRHDEARELLEPAAGDADPRVAQPASYNAGNADLEPALRGPASAAGADALRRAVEHFRQALRLDPADHDAKWNLELAQRLLAQQQPQGGAGGDAADPQGGEADEPAPARPDVDPEAGAPGAEAGMSRAEVERLLQAAAQRDSELQQQKLRRAERPPPGVRAW